MKDFILFGNYLFFSPGDLPATAGQDPVNLPSTTTTIAETDRQMAGTTPIILTLTRMTHGPVIPTGGIMIGRGGRCRTIIVATERENTVLVCTEDDINFRV